MYDIDFKVIGNNKESVVDIEKSVKNNILYVKINFSNLNLVTPETFTVQWFISGVGCNSVWRPFERSHILRPNWGKNTAFSRLASGMPIYQIVSAEDNNTICFSVSDADTPIKLKTGYVEETAELECQVEFFSIPTAPIKDYSAVIRIDMRKIPFYDSIYDVVEWLENECGYKPATVPDSAREPVDSLWYSFHQELDFNEIIDECKRSYELGMRTVIIDDGWQTGDNNRGYAYCGDWSPFEPKMSDMKLLVDSIHNIGMKVMLWYSVPFIGIYSNRYNEFKNMLLDESGNNRDFFALDPRYKCVRDYLCDIYESAVNNWGIDGLKLDFIDSFVLQGKSLDYDDNRDFQSLEEAIHALLSETTKRLYEINPDVMIEFRQSYIGPSIRRYGNMLRVGDCPADYLTNRTQIIDLRFTSGNTAVHSDMVMWNKAESTENAALQLMNTIFAVPQISVKLSDTLPEHKAMIKHYIGFYNKYRDVLSGGYLTAKKPEIGYSQASVTKDDVSVTAVYSDSVVDINTKESVIVNASDFNSVIVKNAEGKSFTSVNCMGDTICSGIISSSIDEILISTAGFIFIE